MLAMRNSRCKWRRLRLIQRIRLDEAWLGRRGLGREMLRLARMHENFKKEEGRGVGACLLKMLIRNYNHTFARVIRRPTMIDYSI